MAHDNVLNTISRGTVIEGKISTTGDIRVEGKVVGTVTCKAKLVVGKDGSVDGFVDANNAIIAGTVVGEVVCRGLLQLEKDATVTGDIYTQRLVVQDGANFSGNCRMGEEAKLLGEKARKSAAEGNGRREKTRNILSPGGRKQVESQAINEKSQAQAKASA